MIHFSISVSSSLKVIKYLYRAHMKAWYVRKGASVSFLRMDPFPGRVCSELCPMTSSMNSWSRNTTWPYAAICSSTDRKQLCSQMKWELKTAIIKVSLYKHSNSYPPHCKIFLSWQFWTVCLWDDWQTNKVNI